MKLGDMIKLLADETRFKVVTLLLEHDFCVGALARRLGISDAAVSQHIQLLRKGGLLKGEKRGYWTHYMVDREMLAQAGEQLKELAKLGAGRHCGCVREAFGQPDGRRNTVCNCGCGHPERPNDPAGTGGEEKDRDCRGKQDCKTREKKGAE